LPIGTKRRLVARRGEQGFELQHQPFVERCLPGEAEPVALAADATPSCRVSTVTTRTLLPFGHSTAAIAGSVGSFRRGRALLPGLRSAIR
jgi:hypothetical protein